MLHRIIVHIKEMVPVKRLAQSESSALLLRPSWPWSPSSEHTSSGKAVSKGHEDGGR